MRPIVPCRGIPGYSERLGMFVKYWSGWGTNLKMKNKKPKCINANEN
jgi:hypothetical protein